LRYLAMSSTVQNVGYLFPRRHDHQLFCMSRLSAKPYESLIRRNVPSLLATKIGYRA
jgi:hypothetical protein